MIIIITAILVNILAMPCNVFKALMSISSTIIVIDHCYGYFTTVLGTARLQKYSWKPKKIPSGLSVEQQKSIKLSHYI